MTPLFSCFDISTFLNPSPNLSDNESFDNLKVKYESRAKQFTVAKMQQFEEQNEKERPFDI